MAADDANDTSAIAPSASVVRKIIAVLRCDEDVFRDFQKFAGWLSPTPFGAVAGIETPEVAGRLQQGFATSEIRFRSQVALQQW
jgi:hypothetical protein